MGKFKERPLSLSEMRNGYHAAIEQARYLIDEARLLLDKQRYPGAFHRSVIALEELGKARILFYQAGMVLIGQSQGWKTFWRSYYSHVDKLEYFMLWYDLLCEPIYENADAVEAAFRRLRGEAVRLDRLKQSSAYSDLSDSGFQAPCPATFEKDAAALCELAQSALGLLGKSSITSASEQEFADVVSRKVRFARALGYFDCSSPKEFHAAVSDSNAVVWVRGKEPPTDEKFLTRVAERYEVIPPLLPVTLPQLRESGEFASFLGSLRASFGYPDWVVLGVVYNIVINERPDVAALISSGRLNELLSWGEDTRVHQPLKIGVFTDFERFESMLDLWLISFMTGLGIVPEIPEGTLSSRIRRVAAAHYGIFNRDVEHAAVFVVS